MFEEKAERTRDSYLDMLTGQAYYKYTHIEIKGDMTKDEVAEPYSIYHAVSDTVDKALENKKPRQLFYELIRDSEITASMLMGDEMVGDYFIYPEARTDVEDLFINLSKITVRHQLEIRYPQVLTD